MPLYAITQQGLAAVPATSFATEGLRERQDIQRLVRNNVACLEEGLLVLAEEFGGWADSQRRIDLLCLDTRGNLVVVELKRTEDGGHMELQALRYAAMVSAMTLPQAADTLARHRNATAPDHEAARAAILDHLGWERDDEGDFAADTRIILAAADFGKELTTAVLWLRDYGIDITCIRLRPYRLDGGPLLLDVQPLIPLPETAAFQTRIEEKRVEERQARTAQDERRARFLHELAKRAEPRTPLHHGRAPSASQGVLSGAIGKAGISINYVIGKDVSRVEVLLQRDDAQQLLKKLEEQRASIEKAFGGPLVWQMKEGVRQCRVLDRVDGGYDMPEVEWRALHDRLIDAMIRLDRAFRQKVEALA